jgi:SAM-dependent methyltransferase
VLGVDYSLTSVKQASAFNRSSIQAGRCSVRIGDISTLRLSPETYDLATAFETVYFWPDLVQCFKNIFNGLKPGGIFLIVNESDGTDVAGLKYEKIIDGMKVYSAPLLEHALKDAGFTTVKSFHRAEKPWIAVLAEK